MRSSRSGSPDQPLRVVVVERSSEARSLLRMALTLDDDFVAVADAAACWEGVQACLSHQPDLVVLDAALPAVTGLRTTETIRELCPDTTVVLLTDRSDPDVAAAGVGAGAHHVVARTSNVVDLVDSLRALPTLRRHGVGRG